MFAFPMTIAGFSLIASPWSASVTVTLYIFIFLLQSLYDFLERRLAGIFVLQGSIFFQPLDTWFDVFPRIC